MNRRELLQALSLIATMPALRWTPSLVAQRPAPLPYRILSATAYGSESEIGHLDLIVRDKLLVRLLSSPLGCTCWIPSSSQMPMLHDLNELILRGTPYVKGNVTVQGGPEKYVLLTFG